jgi:Tol biopolymer transport system component
MITRRTQKTLWALLALLAVGLAAATAHLYSMSRSPSATAQLPAYRIAYVSFSQTTGIPQLYTCDLQGGDVRPLVESRSGDILPVSEPLPAAPKSAARIAFVRFRSDPGGDTGTQLGAPGGVYIVSSDGGQEKEVSETVERPLPVSPAWSQDGKQLAFAGVDDLNDDGAYVSEEAGIYVADVETAQVRRVAAVHATGTGLRWSPTSAQVILQGHKPDVGVPVAYLLDLRTGELSSRDDTTTLGCWSPDGQYIAAYSMADRKIHVLSSAGDELWTEETPPGYVTDLHWLAAATTDAEDGGRFLVLCTPEPNAGAGQVFLSSALIARGDRATWRQLTAEDANVSYATASPDGRWAALTLMQGHGTGMEADLYLLDLSNGQTQQLTQDPGYEGWATWVPTPPK